MLNLSPPTEFISASNTKLASWIDELEDYIVAAAGENIGAARKRAILLSTIGSEAKKVIGNLSATQKDTYDHLVEALKGHYQAESNDVIERHVFNTMTQMEK